MSASSSLAFSADHVTKKSLEPVGAFSTTGASFIPIAERNFGRLSLAV